MANNNEKTLSGSEFYGLIQGQELYKYTLQNESVKVDITNLGCSIMAIHTRGRDQLEKNIIVLIFGMEPWKEHMVSINNMEQWRSKRRLFRIAPTILPSRIQSCIQTSITFRPPSMSLVLNNFQ